MKKYIITIVIIAFFSNIYAQTTFTITANPSVLCVGGNANVVLSYSGGNVPAACVARWYSDKAGTQLISEGNNINTAADISSAGTKNFYFKVKSACSETVEITTPVQVVNQLQATNIKSTCDKNKTFYYVEFDISGGNSAKYNVSGMSGGTITGNHFLSNNINIITQGTQNYSFVLSDNACTQVNVSSSVDCSCEAKATITDINTTICQGTDYLIDVVLEGTPNWTIKYTDGTNETNTSATASPLKINAKQGGTFKVVSLSDANCQAATTNLKGTAVINANSTIPQINYPNILILESQKETLINLPVKVNNRDITYSNVSANIGTANITNPTKVEMKYTRNTTDKDAIINYKICDVLCPTLCNNEKIGVNINFQLNIPNILSPNNKDKINDEFVVQGIENYENNEVFIFNRWGTLVFYKKKYDNTEENIWKGKSQNSLQGDTLPEGIYFYIIKPNKENIGDKTGWIKLAK